MTDTTRKTLSIYIDQQVADNALKTLQASADKLTASITKGQAAGKNVVSELKKLDTVNTNIKSVQNQIDNGLRPSLVQTQSTVTKLRNELARMSADAPGYGEKLATFKAANTQLSEMKENLAGVKAATNTLGSTISDLFMAGGVTGLIYEAADAIKTFFTQGIEESNKYQASVVDLQNTLQNVGRGDLAGVFVDNAEKLAQIYKAIKPADIIDAETKLVDYGKLSQNQISGLTDVIINYARKQGISIQESTDVFTKALEGNSKGLKTYGVNVKDATTVTDRYNLIIGELAPKLKGTEAAFEETTSGAFDKFKTQLGEIGKAIGDFITGNDKLEEQQQANAVTAKKEADTAQTLVDKYESLSKKTNQTAQDKEQLKNITADLVETFGTSVVAIDKETGAMTLNIDATKELIKQKLLVANQQASGLALQINSKNDDIQKAADQVNVYKQSLADLGKQYGVTNKDFLDPFKDYDSKDLNSFFASGNATQDAVDKINKLRNAAYNLGTQISDNKIDVADLTKQLNQFGYSADDVKKLFNPAATDPNAVIGTGDPNDPGKAARDAEAKKYEELLQHRQEFQTKLDELKELNKEASLGDDEKEIQTAKNKYTTLLEEAKKYWDANTSAGKKVIADVMATQSQDLQNIYNKQLQKGSAEQYKDAIADIETFTDQEKAIEAKKYSDGIINKLQYEENLRQIDIKAAGDKEQTAKDFSTYTKDALADVTKYANDQQKLQTADEILESEKRKKQAKDDALAKATTTELNAPDGSAAQLDAQKALLNLKLQQDQEYVDGSAAIRLEKETELNKAVEKLDKDFYTNKAKEVLEGFQGIDQVIQSFNAAADARDENQINNINAATDQEKAQFQNLLNTKLINQDNYNQKVTALEKQQQQQVQVLKKQQFDRDKKAEVIQAEISGAQSILSALATSPFLLGLILAAVATVKTTEQISAIKSKQFASYGGGGVFDGPLHSDGGMPVYNPKTRRKVAELEGGEPILSRRTYSNNRHIVDQLLYSSMYKSGASIQPTYRNRPYQGFNYSAINSTIGKLNHFERGGVFTTETQKTPADTTFFDRIGNTLNNIDESLKTPQQAIVQYGQIQIAQDLNNSVQSETTLIKT